MAIEQIKRLTQLHNYFEIRFLSKEVYDYELDKLIDEEHWVYYGPDNEDVDADSFEELLDKIMKHYGEGG